MGERLGVTQQSIVAWEKDPGNLSLKTIAAWHHEVNADGKAMIKRLVDDFFALRL